MHELKDKFGEGLGKIQGGIDTGRKRLETTKELYHLRKTLKELTGEKGRLYFRMGQRAHLLFRRDTVRDDDLKAFSDQMAALDEKIRSLNEEIAAADAGADTLVCPQCGDGIDINARFCISCGAPVGAEEGAEPCAHCAVKIPTGARYCPFCGYPAGEAQ